MSILSKLLARALTSAVLACVLFSVSFAQGSGAIDTVKKAPSKKASTAGPKVTQIDIEGLRKLLKPNGKPLLINFWATWCDPCRDEFPDLVKLDAAYRGKIDFITVSLDDLADIDTSVPKFLGEMKAEMPAYLLKTADESAAITMVSKDWKGNLPLTILFNSAGETAYARNGKIRYEAMTKELDKLLAPASAPGVAETQVLILPKAGSEYTFENGVADAKRDVVAGKYKIVRYGLTPGVAPNVEFDRLRQKYSVTVSGTGCMVVSGFPDYARGYNQTARIAFEKKFGAVIAQEMGFVDNP